MKMRMKPDTLVGSSAASLQTAGFMIKIAHMSIMLKMIRRLKWKMLPMPSANARTMQSTPVHWPYMLKLRDLNSSASVILSGNGAQAA